MTYELSAAGWVDLPAGAARSGALVLLEERLAAAVGAAVLPAGPDDLVVALDRAGRRAFRRAQAGRAHLPELSEFPVDSWVVEPARGPLADALVSLDAAASVGAGALVAALVGDVLPALAAGYRSRHAVASPVAEPSTRSFLADAARAVDTDREWLGALRF